MRLTISSTAAKRRMRFLSGINLVGRANIAFGVRPGA
jgi:hypothetical protein